MKVLADLFISSNRYLDPGSGSMLIQILIGAVLGAGVLLRVFWNKIKAFFGGKPQETASKADDLDPTAIDQES